MQIEIAIVVGVLGAVIGSFLNVCIHRMPREESIVTPGSHCTSCGAVVPFYHNIPIVSWFVLRGKCASCGASFSIRYPLIEAMTAAIYVLLYWKFGLTAPFAIYALFASAMIVVTFIDLDFRIIPDEISVAGIPIGFALSFVNPFLTWQDSLIGVVVGGGLLLGLGLLYQAIRGIQGMGGGDIKLLATIGAFLGWRSVLAVIFISSVLGSVAGIVGMIATKSDARFKIPYGPFLAAAAVAFVFVGEDLVNWYVGLLGRP